MIRLILAVIVACTLAGCCHCEKCAPPLPAQLVRVPVPVECPVPPELPRPALPSPGTSPAEVARAAAVYLEQVAGHDLQQQAVLNGYRRPTPPPGGSE